MLKIYTLVAFSASAALLAGCSNNSSDDGTTTTQNYTSFAEIQPDAATMQSTYTDPNGTLLMWITRATEAQIPDTGGATYKGFVNLPLSDGDLIGELTMVASFSAAAGSIDSSATGFFHENNGAYTGTLTGTGALVQDAPPGVSQVSTALDGPLSNGGTDYTTSLALAGDIVANGADPYGAVAGTADGNVGTDVFLGGVFAAER